MEEKKYEVNRKYDEKTLVNVLKNFDKAGEYVVEPGRNEIKRFEIDFENNLENVNLKRKKHNKIDDLKNKKMINVKKFKKKGFFSQLIYKYGKGSKARRSYEYGNKLLELGIQTPEPIAYFDDFGEDKRSFYLSEELKYDFTCREVLWNDFGLSDEEMEKQMPYRDEVIRQFAKFTVKLHESGVKFDDYSPGNVLIKKDGDKYEFYLVDLNRMSFNTKLSLTTRMENVSKMMEEEVFARKFSKAYSEFCTRYTEEEVFKKLYHFIKKHKFRVFIKDSTRPFRRMLKK